MPIFVPRLIVEFYEGWGFSGKRAVVVDSVPDLSRIGMLDRVFSVRVFKGPGYASSPDHKLVLYDQLDYKGNHVALGPGFYPNLQDSVRRFEAPRSVRFESRLETGGPEWGGISAIVELYNRPNYEGRKTTVIRDVPDVAEVGQGNIVSSVKVFKGPNCPRTGCRVLFYSGAEFSGMSLPLELRPADFEKGLSDLRLLPNSFNNMIASIKIEGWTSSSEFDTVVFQDEFNGATFRAGWQWVDPNGGGNWRANQGFIEMNAQPGQDLWHGANYDAPRVLRPFSGDFAIETRIRVENDLLEHGGLLIWKNENRFIRLEKTCGAHAYKGDVRFQRHQWQSSSLVGRGVDLVRPKRLYLRVERVADVFSGYASEDGVRWQQCGSTVLGMSDPVMVGLHALAPGNVPPTKTHFDYFRIARRRRDVLRDKQALSAQSRAAETLAFRRSLDQLRR
jgi:regulation of enolase protein 1 (concanavalin A-like superfamily)